MNIIVAPEAMNERVSLAVKGLGWRATVEEIARRVGCTVEDMGEFLRIEKPPRVSFSFEQADISKVIRTIAALSGANIVADPDDVKGMVTVNLIDQPWRRALSAIVGTKGYQLVDEAGGIIRVVSPNKLKAELETRVYQLKYMRPPPDYNPKLSSSNYVERTGVRTTGDIEKTFNVITSLRKALEPEGDLLYISAQNALVLKGTKPKLAQVEKILVSLDREPLQIFLDMQFVSTRNQDLFQVGLGPSEAGILGSMSFAKIEDAVRLPFNVGEGGWEDWFLVQEGLPAVGSSSPVFTAGALDFSGTSFLLKLLKNDIKSRVVQAPKLFVLDNQEATIFVGETIRYAQTEASSSQSGTLQFSVKEADNSPVNTGFQLLMIPHVIPDSDKVMMTIVPTQNTLVGTSTELPGFDKFTVGGGLAEQSIFLPRESSSTLITTLICQHGSTTVLGGLMQENNTETVNKIPWLGDIPFFGYLFKTESKGRETRQLMIFMTPWLVREASGQREALKNDLLYREQGLDMEWRKLLKEVDEEKEAMKEAPAAAPKAPEKKPEGAKEGDKKPAPAPAPAPAPKPAEAPKDAPKPVDKPK
jgi:type IV pilus assembly protein PilQ